MSGEADRALTPSDRALITGNPQLELLHERWESARDSGDAFAEINAWHHLMDAIRYARHHDANREVAGWAHAFGF